ncbi:hypothetical protein LINPERHAP1_LOCUS17222 [Linum perenne]
MRIRAMNFMRSSRYGSLGMRFRGRRRRSSRRRTKRLGTRIYLAMNCGPTMIQCMFPSTN